MGTLITILDAGQIIRGIGKVVRYMGTALYLRLVRLEGCGVYLRDQDQDQTPVREGASLARWCGWGYGDACS